MAARRTAASLATVSHCGVPKLAASPQLKPALISESLKTRIKLKQAHFVPTHVSLHTHHEHKNLGGDTLKQKIGHSSTERIQTHTQLS